MTPIPFKFYKFLNEFDFLRELDICSNNAVSNCQRSYKLCNGICIITVKQKTIFLLNDRVDIVWKEVSKWFMMWKHLSVRKCGELIFPFMAKECENMAHIITSILSHTKFCLKIFISFDFMWF